MDNIHLAIDDRDLRDISRHFPKRIRWATGEAFKMAGGHVRKKVRSFIERGGRGWPPLKTGTLRRRSPLRNLAQLVRFRYTGGKTPRVRIGFFTATKRGKAGFNKKERGRFKESFGGTPGALAKKHEYGRRYRVTKKMRGWMALRGYPLKKEQKYIVVPARPMINPIWQAEKGRLGDYVKERFWRKMQSAEGPFK